MMLSLIVAVATAAIPNGVPFDAPTIKQSREVYEQATQVYVSKSNPDFNAFADLLAQGWLQAHKEEALSKAAKKGRTQATPEEAWELPYANDWLGCVFFQFGGDAVFTKYHFATVNNDHTLSAWLTNNATALHADDNGLLFERQLQHLTDIAGKCEEIIRQQPPEGANNI